MHIIEGDAVFVSGKATSYDTYCHTGKRGQEIRGREREWDVMEVEVMKAQKKQT